MIANEYLLLRTKFLKAFANLPEKVKSEEVIVVIENVPYTWTAATIEVRGESPTGKKILKILKGLGVL